MSAEQVQVSRADLRALARRLEWLAQGLSAGEQAALTWILRQAGSVQPEAEGCTHADRRSRFAAGDADPPPAGRQPFYDALLSRLE